MQNKSSVEKRLHGFLPLKGALEGNQTTVLSIAVFARNKPFSNVLATGIAAVLPLDACAPSPALPTPRFAILLLETPRFRRGQCSTR